MEEKYQKILSLPHPGPQNRLRMSQHHRAAQFAPFAALTDYGGIILETARQTEREIELDETAVAAIDACLRHIQAEIALRPKVTVQFFCPDRHKSGGSFEMRRDRVVKMDKILQTMTLQSGEQIHFQQIVQLRLEQSPAGEGEDDNFAHKMA